MMLRAKYHAAYNSIHQIQDAELGWTFTCWTHFSTSFCSWLKPVSTMFANLSLIQHGLCTIWTLLSAKNLRFINGFLLVWRNQHRKRYGNTRQEKPNNHPSYGTPSLTIRNNSAQNGINKTNKQNNHICSQSLKKWCRQNVTKLVRGQLRHFLSLVTYMRVNSHEP